MDKKFLEVLQHEGPVTMITLKAQPVNVVIVVVERVGERCARAHQFGEALACLQTCAVDLDRGAG